MQEGIEADADALEVRGAGLAIGVKSFDSDDDLVREGIVEVGAESLRAAVVAFKGGACEIDVGLGVAQAVGFEAAPVIERKGGVGDEEGIGGVFLKAKMAGDESGELLVDSGGLWWTLVEG